VHHLDSWITIDQLEVTCFFFYYLMLNMFRMLVHPSSEACDLLWIYFMCCIALVRCVLALRCGSTGVVWYPYAGWGTSASAFTCFIITLFTAQHVSNVSTSIFRSLRLIVDLFHVLYCSCSMCVGVSVWFGWGGVLSLCRLKQCFLLYSTIKMMHGPINLRYLTDTFTAWFCSAWHDHVPSLLNIYF